MSDTENDGFPWAFVLSALVTFVFLLLLCMQIGNQIEGDRMRREAIDRGFAEYDSCTGEWKWKEPVTE